jgi:predicted dehydrogenase
MGREEPAPYNQASLRRRAQKSMAKARRYASAEELIACPDVEAVLVSTETAYHAELAIKCIKAGKVRNLVL